MRTGFQRDHLQNSHYLLTKFCGLLLVFAVALLPLYGPPAFDLDVSSNHLILTGEESNHPVIEPRTSAEAQKPFVDGPPWALFGYWPSVARSSTVTSSLGDIRAWWVSDAPFPYFLSQGPPLLH